MTVYCFRVTDSHGQVCEVAANEMYDIVHVCLNAPDGSLLSFESEMVHLGPWADEHGLTAELVQVELDLVSLKAESWTVARGTW